MHYEVKQWFRDIALPILAQPQPACMENRQRSVSKILEFIEEFGQLFHHEPRSSPSMFNYTGNEKIATARRCTIGIVNSEVIEDEGILECQINKEVKLNILLSGKLSFDEVCVM